MRPITREEVKAIQRRVNDSDVKSSEDWIDFQILFGYINQIKENREQLRSSNQSAAEYTDQLEAVLGVWPGRVNQQSPECRGLVNQVRSDAIAMGHHP